MSDGWKHIGFGIGVHPFTWRLGHQSWAGNGYLYVGPLFLSWKLPRKTTQEAREDE